MNPAVDNEFQQWLSQINQVCGNFTGRLLTERYTGVLDTHFAKGLKLSTVTTSGVNLSRTWQEVKGSLGTGKEKRIGRGIGIDPS